MSRIRVRRPRVRTRHCDPWLSHRQNYTIGLNRKLVRRRPTKRKSPRLPPEQSPKSFWVDRPQRGTSAALRTKLPTGNGEMPENFKYVWLVFMLVFHEFQNLFRQAHLRQFEKLDRWR